MPSPALTVTWSAWLLLLATPLRATDYYACDCAAGADAQCLPGSDAALGTTPATAWRSYDRAQDAWAGLAAGESINFCRGGVFPILGSTQWVNAQCTPAQRCSLGAYIAPWASGDEARPRLQQSAGMGLSFANNGNAAHEGGYRIADLELVCTACVTGDFGIFFFNDIDDVRLERLLIRQFGIGVHLSGSNACGGGAGCDGRNTRIEMVASELNGNFDQGWLGGSDDLLLADNRLIGNGSGSIFQHNLYLNQLNGATQRVRILRNELYRSAAQSGSCQGGTFAIHGQHSDLLIEGNDLHEDVGAADPACWGIGLSPSYPEAEGFVRVIIRGNTLRNLGNVAIAITSCDDCIVENNVIVNTQAFAARAIVAPAVARGASDLPLDHLTVRNNSIYLSAPNSSAIRVGLEGSMHVIASNAMQGTAATGGWSCLSLDLASSAYATVDNNVCGFVAGPGREWEEGSGSLANWRVLSNFDLVSSASAPGYAAASAPAYDLSAGSANAAMVDLGHPSASAPLEYFGSARPPPPDAGAHEFGVVPALFADGFE